MGRPKGSKNRPKQAAKRAPPTVVSPSIGNGSAKPTPDKVGDLVQKLEMIAEQARDIATSATELVAHAVENHHFDKSALAIVRRLYRMEPEKLAVTLPHLLSYIDDLGLGNTADSAQGFIDVKPAKISVADVAE